MAVFRGGLGGINHIPMYRDAYWRDCCRRLGFECMTKSEVYEQIRYKPLANLRPVHEDRSVHRIIAGANRAGKTLFLSAEVLPYLLWPGTNGWYVSASYDLAEEFYRKLEEVLVGRLGMDKALRNDGLQPWQFTYSPKTHVLHMGTGSTLQLKSSEAPNSMHSVPLDYIMVDEAALMPYLIYDTRLVPRLADTGGWIMAVGTFESYEATGEWFESFFDIGQTDNDLGIKSWFHPIEENYFKYEAKGGESSQDVAEEYDTNWSKVETDNPEVKWPLKLGDVVMIYNYDKKWLEEEKRRIDPAIFAARYEAKRGTSPYTVFPKWDRKKYVNDKMASFDESLPVFIAVDPGGTYAVAAVQFKYRSDCTNTLTKGYDLCIIDELYFQTTVTTEEVFLKCKAREWFPNLDRRYHDWWPALQGAIDATANEQQLTWQHLGRKDDEIGSLLLSSRKGDINAGIETLQHFIDTDSIWVNSKCTYFAMEMRKYQHQAPAFSAAGVEDPRKRETPKDAWNHLIKAVIYLIVCRYGYYGKSNNSAVVTRDEINRLYKENMSRKEEGKRWRAAVSKYA